MPEPKRSASRWAAGLAGLVVVAVGAWLLVGGSPGERDAEPGGAPPVAAHAPHGDTPATAGSGDGPGLRIAASGRLRLKRSELPDAAPLRLALDLPDAARGSGERSVRVVSEDGRRLDTTATPLPGAGSGLALEILPGFLTPGRYLIEVDTVERQPLRIRRYVLEVR